MKTNLPIFVLLIAFAFASCKPVEPKPVDPEGDGMRHEQLTVSEELFCNPERGFHRAQEIHSASPTAVQETRVQKYYESGYTLVHLDCYMEDYRDCLIEESYLDVVRQSLQAIRKGGCKCVLRFAYTNSENDTPREAPEELMLQHIAQIKPILQEYVDVIYTMEAGFVGTWGEWYYTTYFKQNPVKDEDFEPRRHILDALLDALPQERTVCVRTPKFKMRCYGWTLADTLTRAEAHTYTAKARLAAHDDAIMADANDMGTFNTSDQRAYWEAESRYTIYGGESCPPGGASASCDRTTDQFQKMHISYLNNDYYRGTINKWYGDGCLETFKRNIGYRIEGREVITTQEPKAGEELKVKLTLVNVGYSAPQNPRDIEMLLINSADAKDIYRIVPDSDPRFWLPDEMQTIEVTFKPEKAGEYKLYLNLPDPKATLRNNPRYSIRLANENCWEEATGYNYLSTVTVK